MDKKETTNIGQEPQTIIEQYLRKEKIGFSSIKSLDKNQKILDIGCGSGDVFDDIDLISIIDGVEPDHELRTIAKNKNIYRTIFHNISEPDITSYDYITILGVLEHLEDRSSFLSNFRQAKKIFITVPNATSFHRLLGLELGLINDLQELAEQDYAIGHKIFYNQQTFMQEIDSFCEQYSFKVNTIGSSSFKFASNAQMSFFATKFRALARTAEKIGIIGPHKFYGAELFVEVEKI